MKFTVELMPGSFSVEVERQRDGKLIGGKKVLNLATQMAKALDAWDEKNKAASEAEKASEKRCEVKVINLGEITDNETLQMIFENLPPEVFEELMKGAKGQ